VRPIAALAVTLAAAASLGAQAAPLDSNVLRYVTVNAPVVAISNVLLVDGTGAAARRGQTVVIQGGKIAAVGPAASVRVPTGATVIDGAGHTLIPGIVGLHDHLYYSAAGGRSPQMFYTGPRLYLAGGVTTIRTTGAQSVYADVSTKQAVDGGRVPGPRIHVTSPYLTGPEAGMTDMGVVSTPEQARRFVEYWASEGATWIKFYADVHRDVMRAAIEAGHQHGMRATGHLCSVTFREAVELGIDDFAHGVLTATDFHPRKEPDRCPPDVYAALDTAVRASGPIADSLIALMVRRRVSMTTTMPVFELFYPKRPVTDERVVGLMAPDVREAYLRFRAFIDTAAHWPLTPQGFQRALEFDRAFFRAGGILASGVDPTGNGGALPGFGNQRGYELLRESGFTAEEAVMVVTLNGAKVLGEAQRLGSVETGKLADLVLLRGDLTADPLVIRNAVTVFKDGVGYDSAKLIEATRGRVGLN
jgi:imidazolonepropionase-like amidohydrolase